MKKVFVFLPDYLLYLLFFFTKNSQKLFDILLLYQKTARSWTVILNIKACIRNISFDYMLHGIN